MSNKVKGLLLVTVSIVSLCVALVFLQLAKSDGLEFDFNKIIGEMDFLGGNSSSKIVHKVNSSKSNSSKVGNKTEKSTVLTYHDKVSMSELDDAVFIGDSRTQAMQIFGFVPTSQVFAEDGLNHENARYKKFVNIGDGYYYTIDEALLRTAPKDIYVGFGINGISFMDEESFFTEFKALLEGIKSASNGANIIITSIIPVSANYTIENPKFSNQVIDDYNTKLIELATELEMYYLDIATPLKEGTDSLGSTYNSGDGVHLNKDAYVSIFDTILTHTLT